MVLKLGEINTFRANNLHSRDGAGYERSSNTWATALNREGGRTVRAPLVLYAINGHSRKTTSAFSRDVFGFLRSCDEMQPRVAYQCLDLGQSASEFFSKTPAGHVPDWEVVSRFFRKDCHEICHYRSLCRCRHLQRHFLCFRISCKRKDRQCHFIPPSSG